MNDSETKKHVIMTKFDILLLLVLHKMEMEKVAKAKTHNFQILGS